MLSTSVTATGIVCPGFGLVKDQPIHEIGSDAALCATIQRHADLTMTLGESPICVKIARDQTAGVMAAWRLTGHTSSATLVVSELVTNALRHALPAAGSTRTPVLLRLVRRRQEVMCLVADPSDRPPVLTEADFAAETGRGLQLVAAHSRYWSWTRRPHQPGKWVWALLQPAIDT